MLPAVLCAARRDNQERVLPSPGRLAARPNLHLPRLRRRVFICARRTAECRKPNRKRYLALERPIGLRCRASTCKLSGPSRDGGVPSACRARSADVCSTSASGSLLYGMTVPWRAIEVWCAQTTICMCRSTVAAPRFQCRCDGTATRGRTATGRHRRRRPNRSEVRCSRLGHPG